MAAYIVVIMWHRHLCILRCAPSVVDTQDHVPLSVFRGHIMGEMSLMSLYWLTPPDPHSITSIVWCSEHCCSLCLEGTGSTANRLFLTLLYKEWASSKPTKGHDVQTPQLAEWEPLMLGRADFLLLGTPPAVVLFFHKKILGFDHLLNNMNNWLAS